MNYSKEELDMFKIIDLTKNMDKEEAGVEYFIDICECKISENIANILKKNKLVEEFEYEEFGENYISYNIGRGFDQNYTLGYNIEDQFFESFPNFSRFYNIMQNGGYDIFCFNFKISYDNPFLAFRKNFYNILIMCKEKYEIESCLKNEDKESSKGKRRL